MACLVRHVAPLFTAADVTAAARPAHPRAALLFHDYLLSEAGDRQIARLGHAPANRHPESPLGKLRVMRLNPSTLLAQSAKSSALFDEIITRRSSK